MEYRLLSSILSDLNINSKREKGDYFEEVTKIFLEKDNGYKNFTKKVQKYYDWARDNNIEANDTGIDLVVTDEIGDLWAVQCKNFTSSSVSKSDIDSFISTSGKVDPVTGKNIFSKRLIFSSSEWTYNATLLIENQEPPVTRIDISRLDESNIDWYTYFNKNNIVSKNPIRALRPHQEEAMNSVINAFYRKSDPCDKGKLIMACGTGKTFTSSQIVKYLMERNVKENKLTTVLYIVPSIALLSQTIIEYINSLDDLGIDYYAVCSDPKTGKNENEDIHTYDLSIPATTDLVKLKSHIEKNINKNRIIFSTYQSLEIVNKLQSTGALNEVDLVICDEAHRTAGNSEKEFSKIHQDKYISYRKILFMTATPKIFKEKNKADDSIVLHSMDDELVFGKELYKLGFGEAVKKDLLTDYKVLILTIDQNVGKNIITRDNTVDDSARIYGCINTLAKINSVEKYGSDTQPMRSAIAFTNSIKKSKQIKDYFTEAYEDYSNKSENEIILNNPIFSDHIDGGMNMYDRNKKIMWLKNNDNLNEIRILSNAKCLSEGVDVPSLDAIIFMNPKNSEVDIVQSIGRVMRKHKDKKYGYVIIPIVVDKDKDVKVALDNSDNYRIVWKVLQALRAHDENFEIVIEKIRNQVEQDKVNIITIEDDLKTDPIGNIVKFDEEIIEKIYGKIVDKVGNSKYLEEWAENVGEIAKKVIDNLEEEITNGDVYVKNTFKNFIEGLRKNLNSSISHYDAIKMLAQHSITRPIFEALFEDFEFLASNPISIAMEDMLSLINSRRLVYKTSELDEFYESIKIRVKGLGYNNAMSRQTVLKELYENFFSLAFKESSEDLGIVYTPNEIVDFIINSANFGLQKYFNKSLKSPGVKILDPFTGTGTFIVNLLNSNIFKGDLDSIKRKYSGELFAYEIVLLAYYIANINIEETYHRLVSNEENVYEQFNGIALADTFNLYNNSNNVALLFDTLNANNNRAIEINKKDIKVIIGNPPYAIGDKKGGLEIEKVKYDDLDKRIKDTYSKYASNSNKKALKDSYIRSFRWATDKIGDEGIVCFVTNGSWVDNISGKGLRKSLVKEYDYIYCFNLRGNAYTSGELRRKEKGNVFGEGSRTPVSIVMLIKLKENKDKLGKIYYKDIGEYLSREDKLAIIKKYESFEGIDSISEISPDENGDWINKRDNNYKKYISLYDTKGTDSIFYKQFRGNASGKDTWVYNFSKESLTENIKLFLTSYNESLKTKNRIMESHKIKWDDKLKKLFEKGKNIDFDEKNITKCIYRPFIIKYYYSDSNLSNRSRIVNYNLKNKLALATSSVGSDRFSALVINEFGDSGLTGSTQILQFLLPYTGINTNDSNQLSLSILGTEDIDSSYAKENTNISDAVKNAIRTITNYSPSDEDVFNYVYAILWHKQYLSRYSNDLNKAIPRVPISTNFIKLSKLGEKLSNIHLYFESLTNENNMKEYLPDELNFLVLKSMSISRKTHRLQIKGIDSRTGKDSEFEIILPDNIHSFEVNSKSPIKWAVESYKVTVDEETGLRSDPNSILKEMGGLKKVLNNLILVSEESIKIIDEISNIEFDK